MGMQRADACFVYIITLVILLEKLILTDQDFSTSFLGWGQMAGRKVYAHNEGVYERCHYKLWL